MNEEHVPVEELFALDDGQLDAARAREVMEHVHRCAECRGYAAIALDVPERTHALIAELDDARSPFSWAAAACVAAAVLAVLTATVPEAPAPHSGPAPARAAAAPPAPPRHEWQGLVDETLRSGRLLPPSSVLRLRRDGDRLRGPAGDALRPAMKPAGAIVAETHPELSWTEVRGARYVVIVSDGANVITESPLLRTNRWRCGVELVRGHTYSWQLEVRRGGETTMHPVPPDPPALFRVLDAEVWQELERAHRVAPSDPLLLGILYARAGLIDDARRELERARRGGRVEAGPLLDSLDDWP